MIKWIEKNRYAAIILTILIAVEIFYFSSIPGGRVETGGIRIIPILYHFLVFFLFNFFLLLSIIGDKKIKIKYMVIALMISIIYAFLDEFHQIFVAFRNPSIQDVLTDTAGIFSSVALYLYSKRNN